MSWPLGARQLNYTDRACQVPYLLLRLTFQESFLVVWTYGIVEGIASPLAMSWIAVTVGSIPELTPIVILTLKYRLSTYAWMSAFRKRLLNHRWPQGCLFATGPGKNRMWGKSILNSGWNPVWERNMLPFHLKFGLWFPRGGVIRSVNISCWGPQKTLHL